jgi:hypothetical protein
MRIDGTLPLAEVPEYAREYLWLKPDKGEAVKVGNDGRFSIPPSLSVELRWAHPEGAVLAIWRQDPIPPYTLEWDGIIRLGGFVERTHILEVDELGIMVVELVGGAYSPDKIDLPSLEDLQAGPFEREEETDPSRDNHWYSLLVSTDSPFADFLHHALVNGTAIDCTAVLGDEEGGWHEIVGLPLLVESVTLLASGI